MDRFNCERCSFSCPADFVLIEYVCPHCGHDHSDDGVIRDERHYLRADDGTWTQVAS
jgi:hypothetical protein